MSSPGQTRPHASVFIVGGLVIGVIAIAIRLPSCHESFWVDELHSAWTVADEFGVVAERAAAGNQTTGYFHSLWVWRSVVGWGELPMRLSSVLTSALAATLLVIGVGNQTKRLSAGLIAGGILAIDPNAVFFGTELRPYSAVMLCAVIATWTAMFWLDGDLEGRSLGGARYRLMMLFWICVAALLHPTSLGVLFWLVPLTFLTARCRNRLKLWRADAVAGLVVGATLGLLAMSSLPDSWARRGQWRVFGQATDLWQLYGSWSWLPIVMVPTALGVLWLSLSWVLAGRQAGVDERRSCVGLLPLLVGVLATCGFFFASYWDWVPLWHRRYFVAALPLLAWSAGVASTFALPRTAFGRVTAAGCVVLVLGFLAWHQGTAVTIAAGRWPVQYRGEPWREAISMINERRAPSDAVWVDSGLIEANFLRFPIEQAPTVEPDWEYLSFPVRGPYRLENTIVVSAVEDGSWLRQHASTLGAETDAIWFLGRTSTAAADRLFGFLRQSANVQVVQKKQMGNLMVVKGVVVNRPDIGQVVAE